MRAARAASARKSCRPLRLKLISFGAVGVGKSCLIKRYCEDKFISKYIPTIGVDYGVKPVQFQGHEVRVNLWDLAGAPDYLDVRNEFYRDTQAALLVYDVTNRPSFEALGAWLQEAQAHGCPDNMVVIVAGTKADLPGRRVQLQEAQQWAAAKGFLHFEVSAATGLGVQQLFNRLFAAVVSSMPGVPTPLLAAVTGAAQAVGACTQ